VSREPKPVEPRAAIEKPGEKHPAMSAALALAQDKLKVTEAATALRVATAAIEKLEGERTGLRRHLEQLESDLRTGMARADRERNVLAHELAASEERSAALAKRLEVLETNPPRLLGRVEAIEALIELRPSKSAKA
jgi:uncharacterized membrane protein